MKRLQIIKGFGLGCIMLIYFIGCKSDPKNNNNQDDSKQNVTPVVQVSFNEDSAYQYIADQVAFGPRVPGTAAHNRTMSYLLKQLTAFCDSAYINSGDFRTTANIKVLISNVVGVFNPTSKRRIVLAAHWDTRPMADEDPLEPNKPADGANDGASGVGVLLEIARQLKTLNPTVGIDIIFFDQEDGGDRLGDPDSWCVGSQFWGEWTKDKGYMADAGILLDMVGAKNATFAHEGGSVRFNHNLLLEVWKTGQNLGYGSYFVNINGKTITDDHVYMNNIASVPTIDIIHYDLTTENAFPDHWHRQSDNMDAIDKNTLKAVGHTVLHFVANWK